MFDQILLKLIIRPTLPVSKPNRANYTPTLSNISTARVTTKQIPTSIYSDTIASIKSGMWKSIRNSRILEPNWFIQPWIATSNNYQKHEIFSQNVWKNNLIVNMILETCFEFDIQELSWLTIHVILSPRNRDGEELVGVIRFPIPVRLHSLNW